MQVIELVGRVLFALIFVKSVPGHFTAGTIAFAAGAGVPLASVLVPFSGVLAGVGGLSVALGYYAKVGAALLVMFLVPVTLMMHAYWAAPDAQRQMQSIQFVKNMALVGGALMIMAHGAGPLSFDARRRGPASV
ncbi:MAG: DoxX family protein [Armatimonadetes bacterium]|nr:DoxX family protein [Armatimonadota bacterium]